MVRLSFRQLTACLMHIKKLVHRQLVCLTPMVLLVFVLPDIIATMVQLAELAIAAAIAAAIELSLDQGTLVVAIIVVFDRNRMLNCPQVPVLFVTSSCTSQLEDLEELSVLIV